MAHDLHPHHVRRVALETLRPTQITVGQQEVREKRREWAALSGRARRERLQSHVFPAVLGPRQQPYIIDHHHLGVALLREAVAKVWIAVLEDLSQVDRALFWRVMEYRRWAHPYDARGRRRDYTAIPRRLLELQDDPYRSLAAAVRNAGGFAKNPEPFAEFLWADFFRARLAAGVVKSRPRRALREALAMARTPAAEFLPGWSGDGQSTA
jgi:hypothetical protein